MDDLLKPNLDRAEEELEPNEELESSEVEEVSQLQPIEGLKLSQMATVYPPRPCDRCVRMNRTCKGIAGSRCEYCKRLKQKCSNATGPARGRHATRLAMLAAAAAHGISPPPQVSSATGTSSGGVRPKRKASAGKTISYPPSGEEDGYEDDEHEPPAKLNKKRRSSNKGTVNSFQTRILDRVAELEETVRQLQRGTAKEVDRINQIIGRLKADVREMEPTPDD